MTEDHKNWNENLIQSIMLPFEADQILSIPLLQSQDKDELTWKGTVNGSYTVKSGY